MTDPTRYPLGPLARLAGVELGIIGGSQPGQPPRGLAALAIELGISHTMAQRLNANGLSEPQADRYAARLGYHPANVWPDWYEVTSSPGAHTLDDFDFDIDF